MSKYRARRTTVDGVTFDSAAEARRYAELKMLQRAGQITGLTLQPEFVLQPAFRHPVTGKHVARIVYRADFAYRDAASDAIVYEDVKGVDTPVSALKRKIVLFKYGIDVQLVRL